MEKTALLILDVQAGNLAQIESPSDYLALLAKTITEARQYVKIIYVKIGFRPGHPEIAASNTLFSAAAKANKFLSGSPEAAIDPSIAPLEGDIVVEKKRVSAFTGSGLDVILRSLGTENLVLLGISTSGIVLSTVCDAFDRDFRITVLEDLCKDRDAAVHELLVENIFKKRGQVLSAEAWVETLKS